MEPHTTSAAMMACNLPPHCLLALSGQQWKAVYYDLTTQRVSSTTHSGPGQHATWSSNEIGFKEIDSEEAQVMEAIGVPVYTVFSNLSGAKHKAVPTNADWESSETGEVFTAFKDVMG